MNHFVYKVAIGYFILFLMALLLTGLTMSYLKTGLDVEGIRLYYADKSVDGLLELSHPHLGGMGLSVMVLGHFFLFTRSRRGERWGTAVMFVAALASITTPFLVLAGYTFAAWAKLLGVLLLVLVGLVLSLLLLRDVLFDR